MKAEDFAAWLSATSRMNEVQRGEAIAALEKASAVAAEAKAEGKKAGRHSRREDALGTTSHERVAAHGCPHCAGREIVGWGRSDGLLRFRCRSCGRTFNALTKTPMAHLRKKEKWLAHARAMIEGKSLAKTAALCGIHPTTAFRWRHRFLRAPSSDKPRGLPGIVEADEIFGLESCKADGPTGGARRATGAERPGIRAPIRTTFPFSSPATGRARPSTRSCLRSTGLQSEQPLPASSRRTTI
jgi:transposase-like protein